MFQSSVPRMDFLHELYAALRFLLCTFYAKRHCAFFLTAMSPWMFDRTFVAQNGSMLFSSMPSRTLTFLPLPVEEEKKNNSFCRLLAPVSAGFLAFEKVYGESIGKGAIEFFRVAAVALWREVFRMLPSRDAILQGLLSPQSLADLAVPIV